MTSSRFGSSAPLPVAFAAAVLVSISFPVGCADTARETGEVPGKSSDFPSGSWKAVTVAGAPAAAGLTVEIEPERLGGFSGCNRFSAPWSADGSSLTLGPVASTRMACPPPQMETEQQFLESLGGVRAFSVEGQRLKLLDENGSSLLELEAAVPGTHAREEPEP